MLVLTRKTGTADKSKLTIRTPSGENIIITMLENHGRDVRVGVEAPRTYNVVRNELLKQPEKV